MPDYLVFMEGINESVIIREVDSPQEAVLQASSSHSDDPSDGPFCVYKLPKYTRYDLKPQQSRVVKISKEEE